MSLHEVNSVLGQFLDEFWPNLIEIGLIAFIIDSCITCMYNGCVLGIRKKVCDDVEYFNLIYAFIDTTR